jgi:hypothetical protein
MNDPFASSAGLCGADPDGTALEFINRTHYARDGVRA